MKTESIKNNRPPYLLGILCLIPLIGAFVGIALIVLGITKYKSKKLIAIGAFGLVITITIYSLLFYDLKFGKSTGNQFAKLSKIELNSLVKSIEFYKLQNGVYPDSLKQLEKYDEMILIEDPLLGRKMNDNIKTTFEYYKIGNKYTLFSVGVDEIANTPDDIYPSYP